MKNKFNIGDEVFCHGCRYTILDVDHARGLYRLDEHFLMKFETLHESDRKTRELMEMRERREKKRLTMGHGYDTVDMFMAGLVEYLKSQQIEPCQIHKITKKLLVPQNKGAPTSRNTAEPPMQDNKVPNDPINPNHYKTESGIECIAIAELFPYCLGNAIKYAWRAGRKGDYNQDLKKCQWYLERAMDNGEHALFHNANPNVRRARRLMTKLTDADLPEENLNFVSYILSGDLELACTFLDDQLTDE